MCVRESQNLYYFYDVISDLYQVDCSQFAQKEGFNDIQNITTEQNEAPGDLFEEIKHDGRQIDNLREDSLLKQRFESKTHKENSDNLTNYEDLLKRSIESMKNRRKFNYLPKDICYQYFCCHSCKCNRRNNRFSLYDRNILYFQGIDKYFEEFDIVNFAKSQRALRSMVDLILDKNDKFLAKYNILNTIGTSLKVSEPDSESEPPKLLNRNMHRFEKHKAEIRSFFESYINKPFTNKDIKLLSKVMSTNYSVVQEEPRQTPVPSTQPNKQTNSQFIVHDEDEGDEEGMGSKLMPDHQQHREDIKEQHDDDI